MVSPLLADSHAKCRKPKNLGRNPGFRALPGNRISTVAPRKTRVTTVLALYEASGFIEPDMIEKSTTCLDFIKKWLWKDSGRIEHHIEKGAISPPEDYCIGCSYQTLYNVLLLKAALTKVPVQGLYREAM